jgi:squalene-hopene/tetraprenyl-beta-curcumene cyclase
MRRHRRTTHSQNGEKGERKMKKKSTLAVILLILLALPGFPFLAKIEVYASSAWERNRTSSDGHFVLYYDTTDPSTPTSGNDVTDEYVQWVEDALVYSWSTLIDGYGFTAPPRTTLPSPLKYVIPVYIKGTPYDGIFYPDFYDWKEYLAELFFQDPKYSENVWYHIILDAHLSTRDRVNVTAAHEFFHAIEYRYSLCLMSSAHEWMSEGMAAWAEDMVYDDVNDYRWWVNSFLANPNKALTSLDYTAVLYWKFLGEKYGGTGNEEQVPVLKKVLEQAYWELGLLAGGTRAVDKALKTIENTYSFDSSFIEWTLWNYLKQRYEEGDLYSEIVPRDVSIPATFNQQKPIEKYATEYVSLSPPAFMTLAFDGDWLTNFVVRILKIKGATEEIDTMSLNWLKEGSLLISETYDEIIFIGTRLDDLVGDGAYTTKVSALHDFYVTAAPEQVLYKVGENTQTTITVTNTRGIRTEFWLGVSFRDPMGESDEYNPQILITPASATLNPGQDTTFSVTWNMPSDVPAGSYQIAVNCWKDSGLKQSYTDNLDWAFIFYVYKLRILAPTTSEPAIAGDPSNPNEILVSVEWIPRLLLFFMTPTFSVEIDHQPVTYELIDQWNQFFGIYALKTAPPTMPSEGLYDLDVAVTFGALVDSDNKPEAIKYATAPSGEPIQRGLAWLRTTQYSDGSWQGIVGVTALCVLGFLNAGYDESDPTVQKAIAYLLSRNHGGPIYTDAWGLTRATYETSLAILALVATYNDAHRPTIDNARTWLVNSQWDESCSWGGVSKDHWYYGGFGYGYGVRPDLSNTQFALLALDAAGLPKDDPTWVKAQVFLHRCQRVNFPITLNIEGSSYTVQPGNYAGHDGGYDGGFVYTVDNPYPYGGSHALGSMTGAGIWGLLLSGVSKTDPRVTSAINWAIEHYTWETNVGAYGYRRYYYYLSMAKALTMYGEKIIGGHDWYQELYNKITSPTEMIAVGADKAKWVPLTYEDYVPDLSTAYAILSLQTRAAAPPVQRLSYLTFILRSNCLIRVLDPEGNLVGYNYMTGLGENQVPTAVYSGPSSEPQYIVIINPVAGTYKLELVGIAEGSYTIEIQGNYGEDITDTFQFTGEIAPSELQGSQVTVTAIAGPVDIYLDHPPEFEKTIDNIPPTTTLDFGEPKYVDPTDNIYVSSATPFTLTAEDNPGGTGVASTFYQIYNSSYDPGWLEYSAPSYLAGLSDGEYSIDYYSTDNIGNMEPTNTATVILDNTPPTTTLTIGEPKYVSGITYVTPDTPFTLEATDTGSGVSTTAYQIYSGTYNSDWLIYIGPFNLSSLTCGNCTIAFNSTDNAGNVENTNYFNVTLVGPDVNGDGEVDMHDIALAAKTFGSYRGHPRWNQIVDINLDGKVNLRDIALIARKFGKHYS